MRPPYFSSFLINADIENPKLIIKAYPQPICKHRY